LRFLLADNDNVTGFLKESQHNDNAVACAISFSGWPQEFWLHFGAEQIGPENTRRGVRMIENLVTGERHMLGWGGIRLRIDPAEPVVIFRCYP
jgi:starch synthase (maltosyl-transferring)